ncbi:MAG: hypothetical protein PF961_05975 [Planctomycetota bacterium]|jgi:hypothetical protein|nr:hypothetical protein [Planctomycetota bacterium]
MSRCGFTLAEVLFSVLLLVLAALSAVAILPSGFAAQERIRFQTLASAKALEVVDTFTLSDDMTAGGRIDIGGTLSVADRLRDTSGYTAAYRFDLERRLSTLDSMSLPLPDTIARRLDAPGDTIGALLDRGGALFYLKPVAIRGAGQSNSSSARRGNRSQNELQRLVFGVLGDPQQNALPAYPYLPWPAYEFYPFAPMSYQDRLWAYSAAAAHNSNATDRAVWATTLPFAQALHHAHWDRIEYQLATHVGRPGSSNGSTDLIGIDDQTADPTRTQYGVPPLLRRIMYREAALALWRSAWTASGLGGTPPDPLTEVVPAPSDPRLVHPALAHAANYLAHAAMLVTGYKPPFQQTKGTIRPGDDVNLLPFADLNDFAAAWNAVAPADLQAAYANTRTRALLYPGNPMPPPYADRQESRSVLFAARLDASWEPRLQRYASSGDIGNGVAGWDDAEMARNAYQTMVGFVTARTHADPNDMRLPAATNLAHMMDKPLVQWDLFDGSGQARRPSIAWAGTIAFEPGSHRSGEPVYRVMPMDSAFAPPPYYHGSADWSAWDARNAALLQRDPGALAARNGLTRPFTPAERSRELVFWSVDWMGYEDFEAAPSAMVDVNRLADFSGAFGGNPEVQYTWCNPNRTTVNWTQPAAFAALGDRKMDYSYSPGGMLRTSAPAWWEQGYNAGSNDNKGIEYFMVGQWGADRDGDAVFSRGSVPAGERLMATEVARFLVYDPVLATAVRN